jgi:hypothetical protein
VGAAQSGDPQVHGQRRQRIGAALRLRAWIVGAHRCGEFVELGVEGRRIRCAHAAPDLGHAVLVGLDLNMAVEVALTGHPHRVGVQPDPSGLSGPG